MEEALLRYFAGEKFEALWFLVIGVVAIAVGVYLVLTGNVYKSMVFPLVGIALIQLVVGATVFFRTDSQVSRLTAQLDTERRVFKSEESQRMDDVIAGFKTYRWIEIGLLALGIVLCLVMQTHYGWYAVGIGLIAQAATMLVLDLFAEKRAHEYLEVLTSLS